MLVDSESKTFLGLWCVNRQGLQVVRESDYDVTVSM